MVRTGITGLMRARRRGRRIRMGVGQVTQRFPEGLSIQGAHPENNPKKTDDQTIRTAKDEATAPPDPDPDNTPKPDPDPDPLSNRF